MRIYLIPNFQKERTRDTLQKTAELLRGLGAELLASFEQCKALGCTPVTEEEGFSHADTVIAIGGDGSIIHAAKTASLYNKAVLGINCGRVGYLSGLEPESLDKLKALLSGDYIVESRRMLSAEFMSEGAEQRLCILNDAAVTRGRLSRMIDVGVGFGETSINYRADGVIVATPTGSTAYSMAAGGPIVAPELDVMIITPVSAHSFQNRPIVLGTDEPISLINRSATDNEVYISVDGEAPYLLSAGAEVKILRSEHTVKLIKIENRPFVETLAKKII